MKNFSGIPIGKSVRIEDVIVVATGEDSILCKKRSAHNICACSNGNK